MVYENTDHGRNKIDNNSPVRISNNWRNFCRVTFSSCHYCSAFGWRSAQLADDELEGMGHFCSIANGEALYILVAKDATVGKLTTRLVAG